MKTTVFIVILVLGWLFYPDKDSGKVLDWYVFIWAGLMVWVPFAMSRLEKAGLEKAGLEMQEEEYDPILDGFRKAKDKNSSNNPVKTPNQKNR